MVRLGALVLQQALDAAGKLSLQAAGIGALGSHDRESDLSRLKIQSVPVANSVASPMVPSA
jgi:hypothetical protein